MFVHFCYKTPKEREKDGSGGLINGPSPVAFNYKGIILARNEKTGEELRGSKPDYLLFLKRRKDCKYEAISGQMDPDISVKKLERLETYYE